jgi:transcriptional regulator with XRE-family HTH domain
MAEPKDPTWRAKWLGQKLRDLRKNKKLSVSDVADYLGAGTATVNRYEAGTFPVKTDVLVMLMNLYGVAERRERSELIQLAEEVAQRGWWDSLVSKPAFADFVWAENNSRAIHDFQISIFSGLLQHPDYAERLIQAGSSDKSKGEVAKLIEARLQRGELLRRINGPIARFLIHEAVLHQRLPNTPSAVHEAQFEHLLELGELPNVSIRVFPLSSATHNVRAVTSSFTIMEMHESWPTLLHAETPVGAVVAETPDIDSFIGVYELLWQDALDEKRTSSFISKMLEEMEP